MYFAYAGYRKSPKEDKWTEEYGVMKVKEGVNPFRLDAWKDLQNAHFNYLYEGKEIKREGLTLYLTAIWKDPDIPNVNVWNPITKEDYEANKKTNIPVLEFTLKDLSKVIGALLMIPSHKPTGLGLGTGQLGAGLGTLLFPDGLSVYTLVFKREKEMQFIEVPVTELFLYNPRIQKELRRRNQEVYLLPTVKEGTPQTVNQIQTGQLELKDAIKDPTDMDVYTIVMKGLPEVSIKKDNT